MSGQINGGRGHRGPPGNNPPAPVSDNEPRQTRSLRRQRLIETINEALWLLDDRYHSPPRERGAAGESAFTLAPQAPQRGRPLSRVASDFHEPLIPVHGLRRVPDGDNGAQLPVPRVLWFDEAAIAEWDQPPVEFDIHAALEAIPWVNAGDLRESQIVLDLEKECPILCMSIADLARANGDELFVLHLRPDHQPAHIYHGQSFDDWCREIVSMRSPLTREELTIGSVRRISGAELLAYVTHPERPSDTTP